MDLIKMLYFKVAAEEKNITQAARILNLTQPALSMSISSLEKELDCRLLNRSVHGIELTEQGELFLQGARIILEVYDNTINSINDINNRDRILLASLCLFSHTPIINLFHSIHPEIEIEQQFCPLNGIQKALAEDRVDFIISNIPFESDQTTIWEIASSPLYLAVSRKHPLANKVSYSLKDTLSERIVTTAKGTGFSAVYEQMYLSMGLKPPKHTDSMLLDVPNLVKAGYVSFVAPSFIENGNFDSSTVFLAPEDDVCRRKLYLIRNDAKKSSPSKELFQKFMLGDLYPKNV